MSIYSPAEIYHFRFVPALFGQWGPKLAKQAQIQPGMKVLDTGCGTGVLAAAAADIAGAGCVSAADISEDMLQVASRHRSDIDWHCAPAEKLPFSDASFDAVLSQFAMMFFESRTKAMTEMWRVLKPGGTLLVAVCDAVHRSPGYAVFAELLHDLFGPDVANSFRAPFSAGDANHLRQVCEMAGVADPQIEQQQGTVTFESITDMIATERACIFTLGGLLNDGQFARLAKEAEMAFKPFVTESGQVEFPMPALTVMARK